VQVVRAFVRLRQMIASNDKMRRKLAQIERKLQEHDQNFAAVFDAIRQLMDDEESGGPEKSPIGYDTEAKSK
jgi:nitrate reductase assembly molybdenum cofactor insertion protein NarJ